MARVAVYIDGFNLYYRALDGTRYKWLNPQKLAEKLINEDDTIVAIKYFTAAVHARDNNVASQERQQAYWRALRTLPNFHIYFGSFLSKTKYRPLVSDPAHYVEIHDTEEKGSDVNLATHLVNDAWKNMFDVALVFSQDSDLLEPLRVVKQERKKTVLLAWLDGQAPNKKWYHVASAIRHVTLSRLATSQFPEKLMTKTGHNVYKPETW
jgi:uncharacterized LabA/DUF88 family protein